MNQEIQAIRFDIQDIGKHVKGSKKRFSWTFGLNNRNHTIILDFSFISGKVKLVVDRKIMLETQQGSNSSFQHPFTLDGYAINILQQGESFELRINNKVFSHIYNQAKTNTEFKNYQDEIKDIKVNENAFQNTGKTVKLNLGVLDGTKKKTKTAVQSQNWSNFGASQLGIPSYFGETSITKAQKKQIPKKQSLLDQDEQTTTQSNTSSKQNSVQVSVKKNQQVDFFASSTKQQPKNAISPSQEHLLNVLSQSQQKTNNVDDFNTMQNMFATMNVNQPQTRQGNSLDLLNSSAPNVNITDYNTMQQLFATNAQNPLMFPNPSLTTNQNSGTTTVLSPLNDFNTMQNMFATNSANLVMPSPQQLQSLNPSIPNAASYQTGNANNLYSAGNLFVTNQPGMTLAQMQSVQVSQAQVNLGTINPNVNFNTMQNTTNPNLNANFNTMQNLFVTSNKVPQNSSNISLAQPITNIENINLNDFNTMQNLFKTSGTGLPSVPLDLMTSAKQQDPFSVLGMPPVTQKVETATIKTTTTTSLNPGMFNTYSGNKSSTAGIIDASSFGTMQKGQAGSVDFFQNLPTQPAQQQQQVPNFSKKKQPVQQDLI